MWEDSENMDITQFIQGHDSAATQKSERWWGSSIGSSFVLYFCGAVPTAPAPCVCAFTCAPNIQVQTYNQQYQKPTDWF